MKEGLQQMLDVDAVSKLVQLSSTKFLVTNSVGNSPGGSIPSGIVSSVPVGSVGVSFGPPPSRAANSPNLWKSGRSP